MMEWTAIVSSTIIDLSAPSQHDGFGFVKCKCVYTMYTFNVLLFEFMMAIRQLEFNTYLLLFKQITKLKNYSLLYSICHFCRGDDYRSNKMHKLSIYIYISYVRIHISNEMLIWITSDSHSKVYATVERFTILGGFFLSGSIINWWI